MQIKIAKLQKDATELAAGIVVGFNVTFDNDRTIYVDTIVSLDLTEEEAVAAAWEDVKSNVEAQKQTIGALPKLVGSVFTPPLAEEIVKELLIEEETLVEEPEVEEETLVEEPVEE